jgi:MSHA biogenesis protein MshJ
MKERFLKLALRIDALTLRERIYLFVGAAAFLCFVLYMMMVAPLYERQEQLKLLIAQQQNNINGIDDEIAGKMTEYAKDPDAPARARLAAAKTGIAALSDSLRGLQHGLVPPERIVPLLEDILRANGKLKLVSLKNLPVTGLSEAVGAGTAPGTATGTSATVVAAAPAVAPALAPGAAAAIKAPEILYRHGVEITVQGSYLDMVAYMAALEAMPTQFFWGRAELNAQDYPNARLTLTLYTVSLDRKWIQL